MVSLDKKYIIERSKAAKADEYKVTIEQQRMVISDLKKKS